MFDMGDCLGRVQTLGAGLGAVHDGVAAIELEGILQLVQTLRRGLITAVDDPAIGMQQRCWPEVFVAIPPVAGAGGGAAGAHHAFIQPIELLAVLNRLTPFLGGGVGLGFQPGHDRGMLGIKMRQVRDQILDHWHMRQRVDFDVTLDLIQPVDTGQRVDTTDVHRTGATDPLAAGAAEGQGWINLVFDLDQRIQDHRTTFVHIQEIGVHLRVLAVVRVPAIDLELTHICRAFGLGPRFPRGDLGIFRKCEFDHRSFSLLSCLSHKGPGPQADKRSDGPAEPTGPSET